MNREDVIKWGLEFAGAAGLGAGLRAWWKRNVKSKSARIEELEETVEKQQHEIDTLQNEVTVLREALAKQNPLLKIAIDELKRLNPELGRTVEDANKE